MGTNADALATTTVAEEPSTAIQEGGAGGTDTQTATVSDDGAREFVEATQPVEGQVTEQPVVPEWTATQPVALPDAIRKLQADKELSVHPLVSEALKQVQSAYDRLNAYTLHLPTVADAKKFAEAFPGGLNDAIAAQERAQELDNSDAVFYSRDPAQHRELAATWAKDDPDAYATLTQAGIEVLAETNPDAYRAIGQTILEQTLMSMYATANQTGNTDAAARILQVHQDIFGRKPGEQARVDPRDAKFKEQEERLSAREQQFRQQVSLDFANSSNNQAGARVKTAIEGIVRTALNGVKATDKQRAALAKDIYNDVNEKLKADSGLDNQLKAIIQAGSRNGQFTPQQQQQWINAIYAKARGLLASSAQQFINEWTETFLGIKRADTTKREQAGQRTDVTGGASPNLGLKPVTGEQLLNMTDDEFRALHPSQIPKDWRQQMDAARTARAK